MFQPAISSGVASRPSPYFSPAAAAAETAAQSATAAKTANLSGIAHSASRRDAPGLDRIVVIVRADVALLEQGLAARLRDAGLVGGATGEQRRAAVPSPRKAESGQALRQHRLLQGRVPPACAAVQRDFHVSDSAGAGPGVARDLIEARRTELLSAGRRGDDRLRLHDEIE